MSGRRKGAFFNTRAPPQASRQPPSHPDQRQLPPLPPPSAQRPVALFLSFNKLLVEVKEPRSRRTITLAQVAIQALLRDRAPQEEERRLAGSTSWKDTGFVFTTTIGTPLDGSTVTHRFQAVLKGAGLRRIRFHDLRHTCATLLLAQGVHPRVVMEILGHSQLAVTLNLYSHVLPAMQKEPAARIDAVLSPVAATAPTGAVN